MVNDPIKSLATGYADCKGVRRDVYLMSRED